GLDYWPAVTLQRHVTLEAFRAALPAARLFCFSAHTATPYTSVRYQPGDVLLFGSESRGLPDSLLEQNRDNTVTLPMLTDKVRSLNLATAVGIALYEALRQLHSW